MDDQARGRDICSGGCELVVGTGTGARNRTNADKH